MLRRGVALVVIVVLTPIVRIINWWDDRTMRGEV
jgi:hypothetical protein